MSIGTCLLKARLSQDLVCRSFRRGAVGRRPSGVRAPVYRGRPCRDTPVCHRVQDDPVTKSQPLCVLVGVVTSCVLSARVRSRVSRPCATENTYTEGGHFQRNAAHPAERSQSSRVWVGLVRPGLSHDAVEKKKKTLRRPSLWRGVASEKKRKESQSHGSSSKTCLFQLGLLVINFTVSSRCRLLSTMCSDRVLFLGPSLLSPRPGSNQPISTANPGVTNFSTNMCCPAIAGT